MPDRQELEAALAALEARRALLGDAVVNPAIVALRHQIDQLDQPTKPGSPTPAAVPEERKTVTVLFADVSGFTALAEKLDPEEVRAVINACFDQLVPVVQKYAGTIDKFIGDEIMALFGAPQAHENDPERALRAALELMERISAFNQERSTNLRLHVGVNTGPVVTGAVGSQERKDYSVLGDAVNIAARLEDASPDGEIYVGPSTYRLTNGLFDFEPLPDLSLKGKTEPLMFYRLVGLKSKPEPSRGIPGLRSDLVGRGAELERLRQSVAALQSGIGGIVSVVGEAGVGKSRLISEIFAELDGKVSRADARALSHTAGMNFWVVRNLLRSLIGKNENSPAHEVEQALKENLNRAFPDSGSDVFPYLATVLQLPLNEQTNERVKYLSTEALHKRILQAVEDYVAARARQTPLLLFWEDVHWCDPSSLLVLQDLFPLTSEVPLLLFLAYRPDEETVEEHLKDSAGCRFDVLRLSPLTREQSGSLVEGLLRIENLPRNVSDLILDRAEGNPFFIEELLRSLLDSGAVKIDGRRLVAAGTIDQTVIPETVQGVLTTRMDRLPSDEKAVLQTAAVIGRNFSPRLLKQIVPPSIGEELGNCLAELRHRDFIYTAHEQNPSNGEYMFKHAITQDVAYNALLKAHRKEIHRRIGEVLETEFANRLAEMSPTLAYHFEKAEARHKALRYLTQAGEHAQAVFANTEAAAFYRSAIAQAANILDQQHSEETVAVLCHVHESLGDVLRLAGENEQARESYHAALACVSTDSIRKSCLQRKIGLTYTLQRKYAAMGDAFDAAERELGESSPTSSREWWAEKIQILLERMHLFYWQGMADEMAELAERHRDQIEKNGTPLQRGKIFQMLGLSQLSRSRYVGSDEAVRLCELAVVTSRGSTDLAEASHVRFTAGLSNVFRGNLPQAIEHFQAALDLAQRVGDLAVQARCLTYLTVAFRKSGDEQNTKTYADQTLELATQLGMVEYVAMAKANLAWLAWRQNHFADANALGEEALKLWHGMEDPYGVDWLALLPLVAVAVGETRFSDAVRQLKLLFGDNQHPLPDKLVQAAQRAIEASENKPLDSIRAELEHVITVSKEIGYL